MTISNAFRAAVLGFTSDEVAASLLTISGDGFETIRVCDNDSDITSNGELFKAWPFKLTLPGDREGAPLARVTIANISQEIGEAIDTATPPIAITINLILASAPDAMEKTFVGLELRGVTRDNLMIEGEIQSAQFVSEPYPFIRLTPGRFPGMVF